MSNDSGVTQGCSDSVVDGAVNMEDEPKAQATLDSHASPVTDTMLEAVPKVAEPQTENVQLQEEVSRQERKESSSNMDVTVIEPTPVSSSSPSPQSPLNAVLGSEMQNDEVSDRTSPPVPQMEPSASDTDDRVGQSEDDEEEEDLLDEVHCKDESQAEDVPKQEGDAQETSIKSELLLDEMSYMSHGDESSSGFLGSPAEVDSQMLSMDLGVVPAGRARSDSLLTESDEFLPFDSLKSDGDKLKRRGSPGRSRVKQVESFYDIALIICICQYSFAYKKIHIINLLCWMIQQGRGGGGFPGRRRPRGGGSGRGRGRSRLKAMASCIDAFLVSF